MSLFVEMAKAIERERPRNTERRVYWQDEIAKYNRRPMGLNAGAWGGAPDAITNEEALRLLAILNQYSFYKKKHGGRRVRLTKYRKWLWRKVAAENKKRKFKRARKRYRGGR